MTVDDGRLARAGLCATCAHARSVPSARGSVFLMCERSRTDTRYPKYPRLPVVTCAGYQDRAAQDVAQARVH